jgi:hypothetical protein
VHQAGALTDFGAKPLLVLTAGTGHDAAETAVQNHLATLSTNSAHRTVAGASHEGLVGEQKYAAATTQAILDVVSSVRSQRPRDCAANGVSGPTRRAEIRRDGHRE